MNLECIRCGEADFEWQLGAGMVDEEMNGLAVTAYLDIECETRHKGVLILPSDFISHQKQRTALLSETYPYCEYPEFSHLDKFLSSFEQEERETYTTFTMCLLKNFPIDKEVLDMIGELNAQEPCFGTEIHDPDERRNMILSWLIRLRSYVKEQTETSPVGTSTKPKGIRYYG